MILGAEKYIYSLFGGISEQKSLGQGLGDGIHIEAIAQHYVSWDNTKHIEMEIFTFLGDFRVKSELEQALWRIQWLKKLPQCLLIFERLIWYEELT